MRLPAHIVQQLRPRYEDRVVTVTGGAGFIGGHLVDALHSLGARVRVIDDLSSSRARHIAELVEVDPDRVSFTHGSILDPGALAESTEGADVVFHLAAIVSVPRSVEDPKRTWDVNATGTLRVLEAARAADARRVVLAASSSACAAAWFAAISARTASASALATSARCVDSACACVMIC